ncbi:MAG: SDR family oxidoreductase [Acidobacteria bacterium]|nr:SDR family oxidoreductase [Acidobacteriota bacterium]
MPLANRVALITGAARGLGKGIALSLAAEGMRIALCYRANRAAAQQTAHQIQARAAETLVLQADVTVPGQVQKLVAGTLKHFGRLDVLINNVGEFGWGPVSESAVGEWERIIHSNLFSVFYMSKEVLPVMRRQRWGRIVNLGAVGDERAFGQAKISAYAAAKAAMVAFTRSLAIEEARYGITVNVVNPANVDDQELTREEADRIRDARFPVGRPPTAEDVAAAIKFFISEDAGYTTGQVLTVSGGWML